VQSWAAGRLKSNVPDSARSAVRLFGEIFLPDARRSTRITCKISMTLRSLDAADPFSGLCIAFLVNPQGCAARFRRPLEIGAAVQLEGLSAGRSVTARVVNCISPGEYEKFWVLGLALDEPGNVWGIEKPPEDWHPETPATEVDSGSRDQLCRTEHSRMKEPGKAMGKAKFLLRVSRQSPRHEGF
jgi:hypothetical protein